MTDDYDDHPMNSPSTPDRLARCTWWVLGAIPATLILIFLAQLAEHWWKG